MENCFNLIDEPWIPITGVGQVSLKQVFAHPEYRGLGGNPTQKIALMKLFLAIAQAAATPDNDKKWKEMKPTDLAEKCLTYLEKWHDRFYLYGQKPFLQKTEISAAAKQNYGALLPEIVTGNTTMLTQSQVEKQLEDAEKAILIVVQMGFALGGKKTDNKVSLTKDYKGKSAAGKPGPAVAHMGLLHNFVFGKTLQDTLWLNLLTHENIKGCGLFSEGLGVAPWEQMPDGEDCVKARQLKKTLMGRLIPLCRFCLLTQDGIHYSEGIAHLNYLDGLYDPTIAANTSGKKNKVLWTDPEKRPWRQLPALLGFINQAKSSFDCLQLRISLSRVKNYENPFAIWSGGLRVSSNAGEQYISGSNDFVASEVWLHRDLIKSIWFNQLELEMTAMEGIGKKLYGCIIGFYKTQLAEGGAFAGQGSNTFWQLCEQDFQELVNACNNSPEAEANRLGLRRRLAGYALAVYDQYCPNDTARQMDAWAKCRPNLSQYLKKEDS